MQKSDRAGERARGPARVRAAAVAALLALGAAPAPAQPGPTAAPEVVTLEEAVELALRRNTTLRRAQGDVRLRDVLTARERMDFLPEVRLSTEAGRSFGRSFSQDEGELLSETSDAVGADVSARVDLFRGLERFASVREAGLREDASRLRLARTREEVVFLVVEGYTVLLLAEQLSAVREEELTTHGELLRQVERLVEVGRRPISDLYQQQAARAEAEAALVEAQRQVGMAETELIGLLQLDPLGSYHFQGPALPDTAGLPDYSLEGLLEAAFARRADLGAAEAEVEASRAGVRAARGGYWPTVSLSFGYGSSWSSRALQPVPGTGADPRMVQVMPVGGTAPVPLPVPGTGAEPELRRPSFLDQFDGRRGGSLALTVSLPLFDRTEARTRVAEARVQATDARLALEERRQEVALQVRRALLDYRSTRAQLTAAEARLEAATRARDAARRRYELGAATFVELSLANAQYVAAASARVQARYQLFLSGRLVEYHAGGPAARAPTFP